jgi:predicted DNA-binding transcriptional regulator AlpA
MTLLLQREAACVLRLSERTLERLRVSGLGPKFIRCGGRSVRYRQSDLDDWVTSRLVRSTSETSTEARAVR